MKWENEIARKIKIYNIYLTKKTPENARKSSKCRQVEKNTNPNGITVYILQDYCKFLVIIENVTDN